MKTNLTSAKLALLAREIRSASGGLNALQSEPIAIIGMACRFPGGASSPDRFWSMLEKGTDAIREVPADRWDIEDYYHPDAAVSGKMITRHGGFLDSIDSFDAEFFGISPREARLMDPQQRIFLEVALEALHDAGQLSKNLTESLTGVYLAVYYNDYARMQLGNPAGIDAYTLSGTAHSLSVGRLSYLLNLRGPSMVVDTACSSSLVAVHLACQSLRTGESDLTLAGGVNIIIRPEENIPLSKWGLVAADGRCKTFDSRADGFIRGEGCGMIVLKRLSDALGDGDRIHAIIRGTAVNQDGRSTFLTAPNGLSQQAVIRGALRNGRVDPDQISYFEAHGTGTKLGDPIEVEALGEVVGKPRTDSRTCAIGSVKTNIGHLEAAAGIAGLIKVVLSLQHEKIPPHLHFQKLNPMIDLRNRAIVIHPQGAPWPAGERTRFAGVSAFGFGGTNAHAVVEEAPRVPMPEGMQVHSAEEKYFLHLSARTWDGLQELARSYRVFLGSHVAGRSTRLSDICFTAATRRDHFNCRAAFIGRSCEDMIEQIDAFLVASEQGPAAGRHAPMMRPPGAPEGGNDTTEGASLETLCSIYTNGGEIEWTRLYPRDGCVVSLPGYPWQHQRHWIEDPVLPKAAEADWQEPSSPVHPLLGRRIHTPFFRGEAFESLIDVAGSSFVAQHRIFGKVVMPAAAFIETVLCAAEEVGWMLGAASEGETTAVVIENLAILEPFVLTEGGQGRMQTGLTFEGGAANFQIFSRAINWEAADGWKQHINGKFRMETIRSLTPGMQTMRIDLSEARCAFSHRQEAVHFYKTLSALGIEFGPAFRGIDTIQNDGLTALGRIRVTDQVAADAGDYRFHPAWLDACLQMFGTLVPHASDGGKAHRLFIPTVFESFVFVRRPAAGPLWSCVRLRRAPEKDSQRLIGDAHIFDENGQTVALLGGVHLMAVQPENILRHAAAGGPNKRNWLYKIQWRPRPDKADTGTSIEPATQPSKWLVLSDQSEVAAGLKGRLMAEGAELVELYTGKPFTYFSENREIATNSFAELERFVPRLLGSHPGGRWGIVYLCGLVARIPEPSSGVSPLCVQKESCGGLLELVKLLPASEGGAIRVWIVTRGAMNVGGAETIDPGQAPLWGLGSVLSLERPDLGCVRIDLDPAGQVMGDVEAIYSELKSGLAGENQVAFRNDLRHVARLVAFEPEAQLVEATFSFSAPMELRTAESGLIEDLSFHSVSRRPPGPGEIEIKVEAVGLNFRDVLNALKMLPGMATPLGGECAGRVVRVGEAVEDFHSGDEVLAFAIGSFRSFVTIPTQFAFHKPETLTFEQAASIPVVFLTAHYGLKYLAKLSAGEKVLIHAASGGVGLAAVQISQQVGAEIFATAGNPEKRQFLSSLGVPHVIDSRSPGFADEILAKTGEEGVDVVFNSLSGEMIPKSLSLLPKGGRFLEIGKRDIWEEVRVAQFKDGISYWPFDLGQVAQADPDFLKRMMSEVMSEFRSGALKPIRLTVFDGREATDAFKTMARAKHIGKIVVSIGGTSSKHAEPRAPFVRPEGSYLITGGLGALGLEVSRWLCERGARHIALVGRQGLSEATVGAVENIRKQGVQVLVMSADLVNRQRLDEVLGNIRREMPPLCGVVHAAGVRDDGMLQNQNWERFEQVMAPKIDGAWNLHRATEDMVLDFFILFSSAAAIIGWPGQGAYAAGNAFLDALAHYRCRRGMAALSINWGPWAQTGMAADLTTVQKKRIMSKGLKPIKSVEALSAFQWMVTTRHPQIVALRADWPKFLEGRVRGVGPQFFSEVGAWSCIPQQPQPSQEKVPGFLEKLSRVPPGERRDVLADHIAQQAIGILGVARGNCIDRHQALNEIGLDSLMAVEMRNSLCRHLGCSLSPTLLFDYPSIEALVDYLAGQVLKLEAGGESHPEIQGLEGSSDEDIVYLKSISDDDAEALLQEELKRLEVE